MVGRFLHGERSDRDDAAPFPPPHVRDEVFAHLADVEQQRLVGLLPCRIVQFKASARRRSAGIVYQYVDRAPRIGFGEAGFNSLPRGKIGGDGNDLPAGLEGLEGVTEVLLGARDECDVAAFERAGTREPKTTAGPADQRFLAL